MSHFINAITQHYADFSGRARRKEYWMFMLFGYLLGVAAFLLDGVAAGGGIISGLLLLGLLVPSLAVAVRRMHDVGKSGWFLLITIIPLVGPIWLLILACTDSQPGTNQYGPNPKGIGAATGS